MLYLKQNRDLIQLQGCAECSTKFWSEGDWLRNKGLPLQQSSCGGVYSIVDNCYLPFSESGIELICHWDIVIGESIVFLKYHSSFK